MAKLQNIWLHRHDGKKLFHISINNVDLAFSQVNWTKLASNARYAYNQVGEWGRQKSMEGGVYIAMVNTNYIGWQTFCLGENLDFDTALDLKRSHIENQETLGFTNVGVSSRTVKNQGKGEKSWAQWNKPWNVNNMTMKKINEKIDFINVSLQMDIAKQIRSAAVMEIIGTKPTVNYEVNNMSTLLMFIRSKLGLEVMNDV